MTEDTPSQSANPEAQAPASTPHDARTDAVPDGGTASSVGESTATTLAEMDDTAAEGREAAAETEATIEELAMAASEVRQNVSQLEEQVGQIVTVVEVITDIAEQTNILALNANIEAARAGEGSEGFAVVADEVKQLAEEAHDRTAEIEAVVESIETNTDETVENLAAVNEHISEGIGSSQIAASNFETIQDHLETLRADLPAVDDRE